MIPVIGTINSGKTAFMKYKILTNLKAGKPSIYINFLKSSNFFSNNFSDDFLIVNSNSFTQISKIRDKPYDDIIFINMTRKNRTDLSKKIKEKIILEILKNTKWTNHELFIDDGELMPDSLEIRKLIDHRDAEIYFSVKHYREISFHYNEININRIALRQPDLNYFNNQDDNKFLNKRSKNLKYIHQTSKGYNYFILPLPNKKLGNNDFKLQFEKMILS